MPGNLIKLRFTLNERPAVVQCPPGEALLDILRDRYALKLTRSGCRRGECGACLVLLDGLAVNACLVPAFMLADREIVTVEGIRSLKSFADIRRRLPGASAYRCGFCSPGVEVALAALLLVEPEPSAEQLRRALSGNLCACGSYGAAGPTLLRPRGGRRKYGGRRS